PHRLGSRPGRWVRTTIQCPTVGTVTGDKHPPPRLNGTADRFRVIGARTGGLGGGFAVWGRASLLPGSTFPGAQSLIIRWQTGAGRPATRVVRSQPMLSSCGSGFSPPYEISYRVVKLPRVPAALGAILPAARGRFPAGGATFGRSPRP